MKTFLKILLFLPVSLIAIGVIHHLFSTIEVLNDWSLNDMESPSDLHVAVEKNDIETAQKWISEGKNVDVIYNQPPMIHGTPTRGQTPLMWAIKGGRYGFWEGSTGNLEIAKLLIANGADIYAKSYYDFGNNKSYDMPVFMYSLTPNNIEIFKYIWEVSDKAKLETYLNSIVMQSFKPICDSIKKPELFNYVLNNVVTKSQAKDVLV